MSDRSAFLASIIAAPDDDTPRLVFADWLDENGDPARAEFVRVQIELSRPAHFLHQTLAAKKRCKKCKERIALVERAVELMEGVVVANLGGDWVAYATESEVGYRNPVKGEQYGFVRGFIARVVCGVSAFHRIAGMLVWNPGQGRQCPETAHPVEEVFLTTSPHDRTFLSHLRRDYPGIKFGLTPRGTTIEGVHFAGEVVIPQPRRQVRSGS